MNKDLASDLEAAETLQEYLAAAAADGMRVEIMREDFTDEIRAFVALQPGWIVIGGDEDARFVVCPPREPVAPPTDADYERWAQFVYPQQRTQERDPRGFWDMWRELPRF